MGQIHHGSATTTAAVRRAIQHSQESLRALAQRYGAYWQNLPERYGKWKSVHARFTHWAKTGVWEKVFAELIKDRDNKYLMLDRATSLATRSPAVERIDSGSSFGLWI